MAVRISKLALIQQRRKRLEGEIASLRSELESKEATVADLLIAERVLADISDAEPEKKEPEVAKGPPAPKWAETRTPKPEGTPTVPEMIVTVLRDAPKSGRKGLEPREITALIATRWWPDVTINSVGPIAWRMYKRGELSKRETRYSLPKSDEGTSETTPTTTTGNPSPGKTNEAASPARPPSTLLNARRMLLGNVAMPGISPAKEKGSEIMVNRSLGWLSKGPISTSPMER
jgi:hypothetical protein